MKTQKLTPGEVNRGRRLLDLGEVPLAKSRSDLEIIGEWVPK